MSEVSKQVPGIIPVPTNLSSSANSPDRYQAAIPGSLQSPQIPLPGDKSPGRGIIGQFYISRFIFIRVLALVLLVAFYSIWSQLDVLIAANGILPAQDYLDKYYRYRQARALYLVPSVFWLNSSDLALNAVALLGVLASVFLFLGILETLCLSLCLIFYLSLVSVGQVFFSFQWDSLLLEAAFLSLFLTSFSRKPMQVSTRPLPKFVNYLIPFLLFRLMFASGSVKLMSNDPVWLDLSALTFHYYTQPIPNPLSYFLHHLPVWFHKTSTFIMFVIELAAPWFFFASRKIRHIAAFLTIFLQLLILLTGNYAFFNLLTIGLCLMLIDDVAISRFVPLRYLEALQFNWDAKAFGKKLATVVSALAFCLLVLGFLKFAVGLGFGRKLPKVALQPLQIISPYRLVNNYGLFARMTTERPELVIEGSQDGENWKAYEFHYKPGALDRIPPIVAPHQPRVDWQMWFASFSHISRNAWVVKLLDRILDDSPSVKKLFSVNPFENGPPNWIRVRKFNYQFTTPEERAQTGTWWKREYVGDYLPQMRRKSG